jgi:GNAT superfamily N-acetyltransferase
MIKLVAVLPNERNSFVIWKDKFADEYNNSSQHRSDRVLLKGIKEKYWKQAFKLGTFPHWIKLHNQTIGIVMTQRTIFTWFGKKAPVNVVTDVYVDPNHRGKGVLRETLLMMRDKNFIPIAIDKLKLLNNAEYYASLGFKYGAHWHEQELVVISPVALINEEIWQKIIPEGYVLGA